MWLLTKRVMAGAVVGITFSDRSNHRPDPCILLLSLFRISDANRNKGLDASDLYGYIIEWDLQRGQSHADCDSRWRGPLHQKNVDEPRCAETIGILFNKSN